MNDDLHGPVNLVAPEQATNREFTRKLASVLRRPALVPVPAFGLRALFGAMADELLLASARVVPSRLIESGYLFRHPNLQGALESILGRARNRQAWDES
jgi:NAD dependent epimerase/dehydratase family enzyme